MFLLELENYSEVPNSLSIATLVLGIFFLGEFVCSSAFLENVLADSPKFSHLLFFSEGLLILFS